MESYLILLRNLRTFSFTASPQGDAATLHTAPFTFYLTICDCLVKNTTDAKCMINCCLTYNTGDLALPLGELARRKA